MYTERPIPTGDVQWCLFPGTDGPYGAGQACSAGKGFRRGVGRMRRTIPLLAGVRRVIGKMGPVVWITVGMLLAGGIAYAFPASNGVIHGCVSNSGNLRVINTESGQVCRSNETNLTWNQQGPQGPPGPAATIPAGTASGLRQLVGSLDPSQLGTTEQLEYCPSGQVVLSASAWLTTQGAPTAQIPVLAQVADSNAFKTYIEVDWTAYSDLAYRVSWTMLCGTLSQ